MEEEIIQEGEFNYLEKGEGQTLILLHGLFGALSNFTPLIEHFSKSYKVVIPLLPIYEIPLLKTGVKSLTQFLVRFIDFKEYQKVNLLGNSLGGHIALMYSSMHLQKVNTLILTGSSGLYENAFGGSFP